MSSLNFKLTVPPLFQAILGLPVTFVRKARRPDRVQGPSDPPTDLQARISQLR